MQHKLLDRLHTVLDVLDLLTVSFWPQYTGLPISVCKDNFQFCSIVVILVVYFIVIKVLNLDLNLFMFLLVY